MNFIINDTAINFKLGSEALIFNVYDQVLNFKLNASSPENYYRILEDGYYRLLEDGSRRLLE